MRTLDDAIKRAENLRDFRNSNEVAFGNISDYQDIVNLATEVERLRSDGVTSAPEIGAEMGALYKERDRLRQMVTLGSRQIVESQEMMPGQFMTLTVEDDHGESW